MKRCECCNRPATVFCRIQVGTECRQMHLCAECARREGVSAFPSLFSEEFSLGTFSPFTLLNTTPKSAPCVCEEKDDQVPAKTSTLAPAKSAPTLATLKAQLKRAIRQEDYLKAATLRDRIRAMEKGERV